MTCHRLRDDLRRDGTLEGDPGRGSVELAEHLARCPECNRVAAAQRELRADLDLVRDSVPDPGASLDSAVLQRYRGYFAHRSPHGSPLGERRTRAAFGVIAAASLVLVGVYTLSPRLPPPAHRPMDSRPGVEPHGRRDAAAAGGVALDRVEAAAPKGAGLPRPVPPSRSPTPIGGRSQPFHSLMYCDSLSCDGAMDVIRVRLPSPVLGLPPTLSPDGVVSAEVLVGPDGVARGIRLVQ